MAKKDIADVNLDEDEIRRMIAGNIPAPSPGNEKAVASNKTDIDAESRQADRQEKKRKSKSGYADLYLTNRKIQNRRQLTIYLSEENYKKICGIIKITDGLSAVILINNILENHFEEYESEILELHKSVIANLFNK